MPYSRKYYDKNKEKCLAATRKHKTDGRRLAREVIRKTKDTPCKDCGVRYPSYVMDFDHLPEKGKKHFTISNLHDYNLDRVKLEIAKCEVVCANCHRERTEKRKKLLFTP